MTSATSLPAHKPVRWLGPIVAIYWLAAFSGTHLPNSALPMTTWGDKAEHFTAYGGLGFLLSIWIAFGKPNVRHPSIIALAVALTYGAIDEITQPIVYRVCDFGDWIADAIGSSLGVLLGTLVVFVIRRWLSPPQRI